METKLIARRMITRRFNGLFMIFLILMLPLYSAQVLGAPNVKVTKNQGEDGINQYIDANSDTWNVDALISNLPAGSSVNPEEVQIQVGANQRPFQSCQEDISGLLCSYVSPLSDGITEGEYKFQVLYNYLEQGLPKQALSTVNTIKADGSGPDVVINSFAQDENGKVILDFRVTENPAFAVGLAEVKIIDAESGSVLKSLTSFSQDLTQTFSEEITTAFNDEGWRKVKVQAADRLGHSTASSTVSSFIDVVAPKISTTMNLTTFGEYLPPFPKRTDIIIDLEESSSLVSISAASDNAQFSNEPPACNGIGGNVLRCVWSNVLVQPVSPVVVQVTAKDSKGNTAVQEVHSADLQSDTQAPQVISFGSTGKYLDNYYVNNEGNIIILEVSDQGSGVDLESISANLGELGASQTASPDNCDLLDNGNYLCSWKTSGRVGSNGETLRISLNDLKDIAGNQATLPDISHIVDDTKPVVIALSAFGISEIGAKDYFQSGDLLQVKATIKEKTGFKFKINVNDLISGPSAAYPESEDNQAGWVIYSSDVCEEVEPETWDCSFVVEDPLLAKTNAEISFQLADSSGNLADSWIAGTNLKLSSASNALYHFDILGLSEEGQYWSVGKSDVKQMLKFIDLDVVPLTYTRMPLQITFKAANPSARMLRLQALDCSPAAGEDYAPEVSRTLFYGGSFPAGEEGPVSTNLILEFSPLDDLSGIVSGDKEDFTGKDFNYICRFNVYSRSGKEAIRIPEVEEVPVTVTFAYSSLGAVDENLAKKITEIRENDFYEFADAMRYVTDALQWIKYISGILNVVNNVLQIFDIFSSVTVAAANVAEDSVVAASAGEVLRGTCLAVQNGETTSLEFIETIQTIVQVLNCNPNIADQGVSDVLGWYGAWQQTVLDVYNGATGGIIGMPKSTSLYDNIYVSSIGLCVPGILYNLQKLQEIHCRKIICYGREVPQGIATVESCDQLYDLQVCEYVTGPVAEVLTLNAGSLISDLIKKLFNDPIGLISAAASLGCQTFCHDKATGGTGLWACKTITVLDKLFDIINTIASAVQATPSVTSSPYCSIADKIKVSDLTQKAPEATASSTSATDPREGAETASSLG